MLNNDRVIQIDFANKIEVIAEQVDSILTENVFDYIEAMASQLAIMANESDDKFLGYLLSVASAEANIRKSHSQGRY